MTTGSYPIGQNDEDLFDFSAWMDFTSTHPSEFPLLSASEPENPSGKVLALLKFDNSEINRQQQPLKFEYALRFWKLWTRS